MARRTVLIAMFSIAPGLSTTRVSAQAIGVSAGYAQPASALRSTTLSGYVVAADLSWRSPSRFLNWRTSASFTGLQGPVAATGTNDLPDAKIYGFTGAAVLAPRGNGLLPYVAGGPGAYGYRSYTEYRLGWHAEAGLERAVGNVRVFAEAKLSSFTSDRLSDRVEQARVRSLSIGLRR